MGRFRIAILALLGFVGSILLTLMILYIVWHPHQENVEIFTGVGVIEDVEVTDTFEPVMFVTSGQARFCKNGNPITLISGRYEVVYFVQFASSGLAGGNVATVQAQVEIDTHVVEESKSRSVITKHPNKTVYTQVGKTVIVHILEENTLHVKFARVTGTTQMVMIGAQSSILIKKIS